MNWVQALCALVPLARIGELDDSERVLQIEKMYRSYRALGFATVPEVRAADLASLDDPVLVDVRSEGERGVSMLPGAVSREHFEANRERYAGRPVVAYCTIGARSGLYVKKLLKRGVDAYNLAGSILLWTHGGGRLVDAEGDTLRVHTYARKWALVAEGYTAVY